MAPADQLEYYMAGLKTQIKEKLWAKEPKSLQDAMTEAALAEARFHHFHTATNNSGYRSFGSRGPSSSSSSSSGFRHATAPTMTSSASSSSSDAMDLSQVESEEVNAVQGQQQQPRLGKLTDAERERLRKEGRCFRCREKDHISRNCPKNGSSQ
jgi:hypothetical protein